MAVIVDAHYHLMQREWFPEPLWETLASHLGVHVSGDRGQKLTAQEFATKYFPTLWDPEGELLFRKMADLARKHPSRLIACAGIDPRRKNAVTILRRCVEEWGMRGVKYHPDAGWDPNGRESYRLLERIQEWGSRWSRTRGSSFLRCTASMPTHSCSTTCAATFRISRSSPPTRDVR